MLMAFAFVTLISLQVSVGVVSTIALTRVRRESPHRFDVVRATNGILIFSLVIGISGGSLLCFTQLPILWIAVLVMASSALAGALIPVFYPEG